MRWKDLLAKRHLYVFIGLRGVDEHESKRVRNLGRVFLYLVVLVAIGLLFQWQLHQMGYIDIPKEIWISWGVWLFFVAEYVILLGLVKNKLRYIRQNWLLPIIILGGIPFVFNITWAMPFLRVLRPLLALVILIPSLRIFTTFFMDGRLRTTLLAALVIIIIFGVLVAGVDPNIKNAWDGIWWALATVSTVGYGDVVPSSVLGRIIGAGLVIVGLGVFVVITANFLALALRKEAEELKKEERKVDKIYADLQLVKETQDQVMKLLRSVKRRIELLENEKKK